MEATISLPPEVDEKIEEAITANRLREAALDTLLTTDPTNEVYWKIKVKRYVHAANEAEERETAAMRALKETLSDA